MSAAEIVCVALGLVVAIPVGGYAFWWARRQVRLAEALSRRGWLIVGCPFWTGPQVTPPAGKTADEIRADVAAALREAGIQ